MENIIKKFFVLKIWQPKDPSLFIISSVESEDD
jgi:hypothetical protein